jgi:hypothetical protein
MVTRHSISFRFLALVILAALGTGGCASSLASNKYVAFATRGQPPDLQLADRAQCEDIATRYRGSDGDAAVAGALIGGASGAAMGASTAAAFHGNAGRGAAIGAGVGLALGLIDALAAVHARYTRIYLACMAARGYTLGG